MSFCRYLLGFGLVIIVFFVLSGLAVVPFSILVPDYSDSVPLSVVATLLEFVIAFFTIPLIVRVVRKRPARSIAMSRLRFESWNFLAGFVVSLVIGVLTIVLSGIIGGIPIQSNPDFELRALLLLIVVGFVGIFIQEGSEELLFRGYITQFVRR